MQRDHAKLLLYLVAILAATSIHSPLWLSAGLLLRWKLLYGLLMYGVACLLMGGFIALHG